MYLFISECNECNDSLVKDIQRLSWNHVDNGFPCDTQWILNLDTEEEEQQYQYFWTFAKDYIMENQRNKSIYSSHSEHKLTGSN